MEESRQLDSFLWFSIGDFTKAIHFLKLAVKFYLILNYRRMRWKIQRIFLRFREIMNFILKIKNI
ncbi:hypothetical protein BAVI_10492 [Neobacillus vireti LMG 21834]|uniref:Uncharacterized protein n=1 Tax=Neobacillus vireti LMG 21834 TaxID=1131730 RepID=A0AB94IP67_9BACI|nr:hypothetical protein BAVI_10492 [Neobacillus vireti LMG 21834]KLT19587.1 hypothetical protein AA980_03025 [Neobacillus vireti]